MSDLSPQIKLDTDESSPKKLKITISEFKFRAIKRKIPVLRSDVELQNQTAPAFSKTLDNWRKMTSYRTSREKSNKQQKDSNKIFFNEEKSSDLKPNMFLTWRQRTASTHKIRTVTDRIVQQVVKNIKDNEIKCSNSQKRLPVIIHDLEVRKSKRQTRARIVDKSPMQLITRKLQCEGRQIKTSKKIIPYSIDKIVTKQVEKNNNNECLHLMKMKLSGWERHNRYQTDEIQF